MSATSYQRVALLSLRIWLPVLLLLGASVPSQAQPKSCYSCHKGKSAEFDRKYRHEPVAKEDCEACHLRHGFANMLILKKTGRELCTPCHTDFDSTLARSGNVVHPAVSEGLCATCHNPHASDRPGLLRAVDGDLACFVCHKGLKDSTGSAVAHAPFAERRCGVCHVDHAGARPGLLKAEVDALCFSCHAAERMSSQHAARGLTMTGLTCVGCHDPHRSTGAKLVSDRVHRPVAAGQCDACHIATAGAAGAAPADSSWAGCQACHDDIAAKLAKTVAHAPAAAGECYTCHSAHRSSRPSLLRSGVAELCQSCHEDMSAGQLANMPSVHAPVRTGQCQACHDPHGTDQPKLLKSAGDQLCLGCHEQEKFTQSRHLQTADAACLDCHAPHVSHQPALLATDPQSTCLRCHQPDLNPTMVAHEPVKQGNCSLCHDAHAGSGRNLRAAAPQLCFNCHQSIARFVAEPVKHPPTDDCAACHGPHQAPAANLLLKAQGEICADCHPAKPDAASKSVHAPYLSGDCSGCHNPHGSAEEALLGPRRQMEPTPMGSVLRYPRLDSTDVSLCQTCHRDRVEFWRSQPIQHGPVKKGDCRVCHAPHQAAVGNLLLKPATDLCRNCHAPADLQNTPAHRGITATAGDCAQCHDPHASGKRGLLRSREHVPFAEGSCEACHAAQGNQALNEPQPGLCLTCHDAVRSQLAMSSVHAPARDGQCTACHAAHTSNHEKLLVSEASDLCRRCHEYTADKVRHPPYVLGSCGSCHVPHGSESPRLLIRPANTLCLSCHSPLKERLEKGRRHAALERGCLVCHTGHSGGEPGLIKAPTDQLCAGCHNLTSEGWRAAHTVSGRSSGIGNCTSCHDPHVTATNATALIKRVQHQPFQTRACGSCHPPGASPKIKGGRDLCGKCHVATLSAIDRGPVPHQAMADSAACMVCHSPHVGDTPALLRQSGFAVCIGCHSSVSLTQAHVHAPAKEDCANCHTPHGGTNQHLLTDDDVMRLCGRCHENATKTHLHPMGPAVRDRNGNAVICSSCHSPHSSGYAALLLSDPGRELCVRCHDTSSPHEKGGR